MNDVGQGCSSYRQLCSMNLDPGFKSNYERGDYDEYDYEIKV